MPYAAHQKIAEIIADDYQLVLLMEHLGIPLVVKEKTVEDICREYQIQPALLLTLISVYRNEPIEQLPDLNEADLHILLNFLANSHRYYLQERIPAIRGLIAQIARSNPEAGQLLTNFINTYVTEISEHFDYENNKVFPYIRSLLEGQADQHYSVDRYKHLHSDIDESLADIKKLLIKYLDFNDSNNVRRELLHYIFDFQQDLNLHTLIENHLLIPLIERYEKKVGAGGNYVIQVTANDKNQLSERELDVLRLLLEGLSNKEVADRLCLSTHTIISHRKNISAKTGIKSLAGLTIYALTNGIIQLENRSE